MSTDKHNLQTSQASLAEMYQQLDDAALPAWLDADTLVAHIGGQLPAALAQRVDMALADSPALQALRDSLVELAPHAEALEKALSNPRQEHGHHPVHHKVARHQVRQTRHPRHSRRGRWLGAAAAMLLVTVAGVWGWQNVANLSHPGLASQQAQPVDTPAGDEIFRGSMDDRVASNAETKPADRIFTNSFRPASS